MTVIEYRVAVPGQADDHPAAGTVECAPTKRRDVDDTIVLPAPFTARLVEGVALLDLAPTGNGWAWEIKERANRGKKRTVLVPESATPIPGTDLVDVDPATLDPDVEPEAAWWASNAAVLATASSAVAAGEAAGAVAGVALEQVEGATTALGLEVVARQESDALIGARVDDVETALTSKADAADLAAKADASALATKADAGAVATALAGKADASALAAKANTSDVTTALATKTTVTQVQDVLDDYAPGSELAFVETTANYSTTQTTPSATIPGLVVTVTGTGRPIEVEFFAPQLTHSAGGDVIGWVIANGDLYGSRSQIASGKNGGYVLVKERFILPAGQQVTFTVAVYGSVAGTSSLPAASFCRPYLGVVAR